MEAAGEPERARTLTPLRRDVLKIVSASHRPLGAYEILGKMQAKRGPTAPPTVYRSLRYLLEHGLVHRIDSLNAFVACFSGGGSHNAAFLICERCRMAEELDPGPVRAAVEALAQGQGFRIRAQVIEVSGLCRACGPD
jgi:Fur family zinc uptake transcriptional regulator